MDIALATQLHSCIPAMAKILKSSMAAAVLTAGLWCAGVTPAYAGYVQSDGVFTQTSANVAGQTDTLTHTTTAGDNIVVFVQWKTTYGRARRHHSDGLHVSSVSGALCERDNGSSPGHAWFELPGDFLGHCYDVR